jgi:hypothetical protein
MNRHKSILLALFAFGVTLPAFGGVSYTCDASLNADAYAGLCTYLNTTFSSIYSSLFANANATIYLQFGAAGLGESAQSNNLVTYSTYQSALSTLSTDAAKAYVPATEPALYSSGDVNLTSALANALGITTVDGGGPVVGVEYDAGGNASTGWIGANCSSPGNGAVVVASPTACYNGVITIASPTDLNNSLGQGYTYRSLGGSTIATVNGNYDFFGIVEHETDEILGTSSCYFTGNGLILDGCGGTAVGAVDLFRYSAPNTLTLNTIGGTAYFSPDGGVTDYEGNLYDNQANGEDWADFANGCTFVQDGYGCSNNGVIDITTDNNGYGGTGPEVAILNAVGFNLNSTSTPEPGTLGLLGAGFVVLALGRRRLRRN